ncbi:hypothetical protein ACHWQZ_G009563 [Mnemiopsis leidyi]
MVRRFRTHSNISSQFREVAVLAYPGKRIEHILDFIKDDPTVLQPYKGYNAVALFIGTNNIGQLGVEETIENDFRQLLSSVKSQIQQAAFFVFDILPRCRSWDRNVPLWESTPMQCIDVFNEILLASSLDWGVRCIINHEKFLDKSGKPNKSLFTPDGLHPSQRGIKVLTDSLVDLQTFCNFGKLHLSASLSVEEKKAVKPVPSTSTAAPLQPAPRPVPARILYVENCPPSLTDSQHFPPLVGGAETSAGLKPLNSGRDYRGAPSHQSSASNRCFNNYVPKRGSGTEQHGGRHQAIEKYPRCPSRNQPTCLEEEESLTSEKMCRLRPFLHHSRPCDSYEQGDYQEKNGCCYPYHELGKAISQHIKNTKKLRPFTLGLGLSLTQHERFSEQILTCLKGAVSRALRGGKLWATSKFIHGVVEENQDVKKLLGVVLKKTNEGWDYAHVTEGLIKLGFILLECPGSESEVGLFILEECYKLHVHCRGSVMTDLLHRVVTSSPLTAGTCHSRLLVRISRRSIQLLLSQSNTLQDNLTNVPMIPLKNARCVLRALVPVMRYDTTLRDSAILIFRKSLFSKNPDSRRIAVFGLTEMMKKFKVGENYSQSSQLSCSQVQVHLMVTDDINEAVCTEISLLLKRGLEQQGSVRSDIYRRLSSIISNNSKLYPMILQLLEERLGLVTESDPGVLPPVKLGSCIAVLPDQSVLREPVMDLLGAAFTCCNLVRSREPDDVMKLDELLESVIMRSTKSDLEDWDLDKGAEFSNSGVGSRNSVTALTLTAILEVLLENELLKGKGTMESGEKFKKLFKLMYSVQEVLNEKQSGGRGKKTKANVAHFSLRAVDTLLDYLIVNEMTEHKEFVGNLRTITNLLTWNLGLLADHLKKISTEEEEEIEDSRERVYTLGSITKSLLLHLSRDKSLHRDQTSSLLDKSLRVIHSSHMDQLEEYCETVTGTSEISALRDKVAPLFHKAVIAEDYSEAQHLLSALDVLYSMSETQEELEELLLKMLDHHSLTSGLAKEVVTILLASLRRSSDKLEVHLGLATDILAVLGDIETEDEDSMIDEVKYKVVTENSAPKLIPVIMSSLDSILTDIEWGIQQGSYSDDQSDLLCQYLTQVASVLSVTLTCKTPNNITDFISKTTNKFYKTFTLLIKRESTHNNGILKSLEKLAKLVGTSTNQKLYSFLIYLEQPFANNIGAAQNAATLRKQAVSVPGLVFSVEQCERNLIILSKKTKTDLMEHFKRSPARDFKVNLKVLEEKLSKVDDEGEDSEQPKKKRKKGKNKSGDE